MLKKIELQNFQSHKYSILNFHPNINIIIGQSDSGKTAIIRALRWVLFNKPQGEALRSTWGGVTVSTVYIDETIISRIRSETKNSYKVAEQELKAIGADVPEHIKKLFNMNDLNFQHQLDQPFLLSDTPGSVASHFNKIARLEVIDTALQSVTKWVRGISQEFDRQQANKEAYQAQLEKFSFLPEMESAVVAIEELEGERNDLQEKIIHLSDIVKTMKKIQVEIDTYQPLLCLASFVEQISAQEAKAVKLQEQQRQLHAVIKKLSSANQQIILLERVQVLRKDVEKYEAQSKLLAQQQQKYNQLKNLLLDLQETRKNTDMLSVMVRNAEKEFGKEMPDICPLCGMEQK